jgi:hypothetical protein
MRKASGIYIPPTGFIFQTITIQNKYTKWIVVYLIQQGSMAKNTEMFLTLLIILLYTGLFNQGFVLSCIFTILLSLTIAPFFLLFFQ